jgi:NitT/TauT family transport system substrate-binding protein
MKTLSPLAPLALAGSLLSPISADAESLTFAWTPNPQTPQVDIAIKNGYFEEAGLDITFVAFNTGREGFEAMIGGQVDITFMAEFPAAVGALTGQDFAVIGDLARFTGSRVIVNTESGAVDEPADLAGKRIGTTIGTNVNFYLEEILAGAGVSAEIVGAAPPDLVPALARGDLDAIVPFPSFYAAARDTLGEAYGELRAPGYQVHYILAATPEMTGPRSDVLEAFMAALARADADVAADPEAAMAAVSASMQGAVSTDALATMWQDVDIGLKLDTGLAELLVAEADWVLSKGVVRGEALTLDQMLSVFAPAALAKAAPGAVDLP